MGKKFTNSCPLFFLTILLLSGLMFSCVESKKKLKPETNKNKYINQLSSIRRNEDSLKIQLSVFEQQNNSWGKLFTYRYLGNYLRENARFSEAIAAHQNELEMAFMMNDTLEITQALNNLGTDFRRIGALAEASEYHYNALDYAEEYSDSKTPAGMKNKVVSLNGIGNISLTLGYFDDAMLYFTAALEDEKMLESKIGQAINYANIGSIYEQKGNYDSARIYYNHSLEMNRLGKSDMGIGLCYIHLGDIHKAKQEYSQAKNEYRKAYDLMENISDRWHWLEACISIAEINLLMGNYADYKHYIQLAESTAYEIESPEHLSQIYKLKHDNDIIQNNYFSALTNYKQSIAMQDSVQGIKKNNQFMDLRVSYERTKYNRTLQLIENRNNAQKSKRQLLLNGLLLVIASAIVGLTMLYLAFRQRTQSNKMLRELEKTRTEFFTGITHEFRTPLTVILGMAEQLKRKENNSAEAQSIIRQGNVLLDMVNKLLDMAKIKSRIELSNWVHGDIVAYIYMNIEVYRLYAAMKHIDLMYNTNERWINVDFIPEYIDKIIINLLANAIKHTPEGGKITVEIEQKKNLLYISVTDSGVGLLPHDIPHIFKEFYQSQNDHQTGTGIGLALVKRMVEIMEGTIIARNSENGGAEFVMSLPLKQKFEVNERWSESTDQKINKNLTSTPVITPKKTEMADDEELEDADDKNTLILIVEDNYEIQQYIGSLLDQTYNIKFATNGEEGLSKAQSLMPDLIITDLMMPLMDGFALSHAIRNNEILNHIPIIVITAKTSEADRQKALQAGVDAYMIKPFNASELKIRIEKLLDQRAKLREKYSEAIKQGDSDKVELSKADHNFLNRVISIVYEKIADKELNADYVAEKVFMSRSQLNRKIRHITGYSIAAFILHIRLEKARRLLKTDETPIGDIAMQCGFEDSSYFSRVFKQVYKMPPSQFRKI